MQQTPTRGHRQLRKGRHSIPGTYYYLTFTTLNKKPLLATAETADIIFQSFDWLETNERLRWFCICVMPDHIHIVIQLGSKQKLSGLIQSFKSHTAKQIIIDSAIIYTLNIGAVRKPHLPRAESVYLFLEFTIMRVWVVAVRFGNLLTMTTVSGRMNH